MFLMFHLLVNKVKDTNYYLYCIINVAMYSEGSSEGYSEFNS